MGVRGGISDPAPFARAGTDGVEAVRHGRRSRRRFETVQPPAKVASDQNKSSRNRRLAKYSENKSSSYHWFVIVAHAIAVMTDRVSDDRPLELYHVAPIVPARDPDGAETRINREVKPTLMRLSPASCRIWTLKAEPVPAALDQAAWTGRSALCRLALATACRADSVARKISRSSISAAVTGVSARSR